jgi:hypothetical protein
VPACACSPATGVLTASRSPIVPASASAAPASCAGDQQRMTRSRSASSTATTGGLERVRPSRCRAPARTSAACAASTRCRSASRSAASAMLSNELAARPRRTAPGCTRPCRPRQRTQARCLHQSQRRLVVWCGPAPDQRQHALCRQLFLGQPCRGSCLLLSRLQWQGQGPRGRCAGSSKLSLDTGGQATA